MHFPYIFNIFIILLFMTILIHKCNYTFISKKYSLILNYLFVKLITSKFIFIYKKIGNYLFSRLTIFGVKVLNFCVRDGNRCIHFAIVTNLLFWEIILWKHDNVSLINYLWKILWLNPRSISTSQLNMLPCFHL